MFLAIQSFVRRRILRITLLCLIPTGTIVRPLPFKVRRLPSLTWQSILLVPISELGRIRILATNVGTGVSIIDPPRHTAAVDNTTLPLTPLKVARASAIVALGPLLRTPLPDAFSRLYLLRSITSNNKMTRHPTIATTRHH